jgi:hypothetical protein
MRQIFIALLVLQKLLKLTMGSDGDRFFQILKLKKLNLKNLFKKQIN